MTFTRVVVGYLATNCYLAKNDETSEGIIIDPGYDDPGIAATIEKLGMKPVALFLTHGHFDHILGVDRMRELYPDIKVYAGEHEADVLGTPELNCSLSIMRRAVQTHADISVSDGEVLNIAGNRIRVIHTPGHTEGGVCYLFESDGALFSGDTLFCGNVGRSDFPTGDFETLLRSVNDRLAVLPDDTGVFPGHGETTDIGREKAANPYMNGRY